MWFHVSIAILAMGVVALATPYRRHAFQLISAGMAPLVILGMAGAVVIPSMAAVSAALLHG